MTLNQVVNWTKSFLEKYPSETVIFQIKDETSKGTASEDIYKYFKNLATAAVLSILALASLCVVVLAARKRRGASGQPEGFPQGTWQDRGL